MKDTNSAIEFLSGIQSGVKKTRIAAIAVAVIAAVAIIGSFAYTYIYTLSQKEQVYVLDQGAVLSAFKADNGVQKDLEIVNHMTRFHELLFNLSPNIDMINANAKKALELADGSAYDFFRDLQEKQYYSRLINLNAVQQIQVDSVVFNLSSYPYQVTTYSSLYILRESNISRYAYQTANEIIDVERSMSNPHGLLIRKFHEVSNELVETRRRR